MKYLLFPFLLLFSVNVYAEFSVNVYAETYRVDTETHFCILKKKMIVFINDEKKSIFDDTKPSKEEIYKLKINYDNSKLVFASLKDTRRDNFIPEVYTYKIAYYNMTSTDFTATSTYNNVYEFPTVLLFENKSSKSNDEPFDSILTINETSYSDTRIFRYHCSEDK